jgi:mono/diheme cytochrome c family protein
MKLLLIKWFTATVVLSALSISAQAADNNKIAEGAKLYSQNCSRCHNARPASDYSKKEWSVVMPHMREKAHMTGTESLAVEAFLASTLTSDVQNEVNSGSLTNKPQRSGAELIAAFGCQGCHAIKGEGGTLGPNLSGVIERKGMAFVIKKLTDPKFNNNASAMPQFPMTDADKQAIVAFLQEQ